MSFSAESPPWQFQFVPFFSFLKSAQPSGDTKISWNEKMICQRLISFGDVLYSFQKPRHVGGRLWSKFVEKVFSFLQLVLLKPSGLKSRSHRGVKPAMLVSQTPLELELEYIGHRWTVTFFVIRTISFHNNYNGDECVINQWQWWQKLTLFVIPAAFPSCFAVPSPSPPKTPLYLKDQK